MTETPIEETRAQEKAEEHSRVLQALAICTPSMEDEEEALRSFYRAAYQRKGHTDPTQGFRQASKAFGRYQNGESHPNIVLFYADEIMELGHEPASGPPPLEPLQTMVMRGNA